MSLPSGRWLERTWRREFGRRDCGYEEEERGRAGVEMREKGRRGLGDAHIG